MNQFVAIIFFLMFSFVMPQSSAAQSQEFDCMIEPYVELNLSTAVEGILETVSVKKGDRVMPGQILATLESGVEQAAVALARSRAEATAGLKGKETRRDYTERRYQRAKKLTGKQYISPDEEDEIKTDKSLALLELMEEKENLDLARLELNRAISVLDKRSIRSPIEGIVVEQHLSPGEFAKGQPILSLAQIDPLKVEVVLPVSVYGIAHAGDMVKVFPEQPVGGSYSAEVKLVEEVIDAASGTFSIRLELPNSEHKLPAGLSCRIRFD